MLLSNNKIECISYTLKDANIKYFPNLFNKTIADLYFNYLLKNTAWNQDKIKIFGELVNLPRLTMWYGDPKKSYTYSGIKMESLPCSKELIQIRTVVEEVSENFFNSVLLNRYRNGNDSVSWHTDNEKELGKFITIGSVSFGQARDFQLKHKDNNKLNKLTISLKHGSLLLMNHPTQLNRLHRVPKRNNVFGDRINLTFRKIL